MYTSYLLAALCMLSSPSFFAAAKKAYGYDSVFNKKMPLLLRKSSSRLLLQGVRDGKEDAVMFCRRKLADIADSIVSPEGDAVLQKHAMALLLSLLADNKLTSDEYDLISEYHEAFDKLPLPESSRRDTLLTKIVAHLDGPSDDESESSTSLDSQSSRSILLLPSLRQSALESYL